MDFVDVKFIGLVSPKLQKFKRVKADGRNSLNMDGDWVPFITYASVRNEDGSPKLEKSLIEVGKPIYFAMVPSRRTGGGDFRLTTFVTAIEEYNEHI